MVEERWLITAEKVRRELRALDRLVSRVTRARARAALSPDRDFIMDSAALSLHDLYAGFERIFQLIAQVVDDTPGDTRGAWHRELLDQMLVPLPGRRGHVLTEDAGKALGELLAFRHVVRNVYVLDFDYARIDSLAAAAEAWFPRVREELEEFARFIEDEAQRR